MIPRLKNFPVVKNSGSLPVTATQACFSTCLHLRVQYSMQKSAQMKRFIKIIAMRNLKCCGYHFFLVKRPCTTSFWRHFSSNTSDPWAYTRGANWHSAPGYLVLFREKTSAPSGWAPCERAFGSGGAGGCMWLCGSGGVSSASPRRALQGGCSQLPWPCRQPPALTRGMRGWKVLPRGRGGCESGSLCIKPEKHLKFLSRSDQWHM